MYILVAFQFSISLSSSVSDLKWWKRRSMSLQPQRKRRPSWWMKRKVRRTTPDIRSHWTSRLLQQMSNVEMKMSIYSSWRLSSIRDTSKCSWKLQESRLLFLSVLSKTSECLSFWNLWTRNTFFSRLFWSDFSIRVLRSTTAHSQSVRHVGACFMKSILAWF